MKSLSRPQNSLWVFLLVCALAAFPRTRFEGKWTWSYTSRPADKGFPNGDFQIAIHESGAKLSGKMTGTAFNGTKVSIGSFTGTRSGNTAHVQWSFNDGDVAGPVAGTATLQLSGARLHWTLIYNGSDDCWFPRDVILTRSAP